MAKFVPAGGAIARSHPGAGATMTGIKIATALAGIRLHKGEAHFCNGLALSFGRHAARCGLPDVIEEAAVGSCEERIVSIRLIAWLQMHTAQLCCRIQVFRPASVLV